MKKETVETETILLPKARKEEENFLLVSVNGKSWKVMKGVAVSVPYYVAEVIDNAQMMAQTAEHYMERMTN